MAASEPAQISVRADLLPTVTEVESALDCRQRYLDARSATACIVYCDPAVVHHHNRLDDGEAKPGALRTGGEKRLKNTLPRGFRNAGPSVLDRDRATSAVGPNANGDGVPAVPYLTEFSTRFVRICPSRVGSA